MNGVRYLSGEEPTAYTAVASTMDKSGRFASVEESIEWTMKLPSGILASCGSSYGQSAPNFIQVTGEKGTLSITAAYSYDGLRLTGRVGSQNFDEFSAGKVPFQFALEANHFSGCIRDGKQPKTPGEEGLADLLAIEAIYKAAGSPIA